MILASGSVFTYHTRSKPDVCVSYLGLSLNTNLCVWVRCSVGFIMRLHSTGVLDENTISQTSYVETDTRNLGGFGFWKEFHSVSLTLLLLVKFSPSFEQVKQTNTNRHNTGLLRGSVPGTKSSMDRPTSLPTRGHASFSLASSVDRGFNNDPTSVTNG